MDDKDMVSIPFFAHQHECARLERTVKRLVIALIISVVLMFASNALWLYAWNQYDYSEITVDGQDGGTANYMGAGASGVINNGESSGKN